MEIVKEEQPIVDETPKVVKKAPEPVVYDPKKDWEWAPDATFELSGGEFGVLLNTMRSILNTPEAERILKAARSSVLLEEMLARAVSSGVAKEKKGA